MSLLDDLNAIDVTVVVDAKGLVTLALQNEELQKLLNDGPALTVLGDLGQLLASAEGDFADPETYLAPLVGALGSISGEIAFDNTDINAALDVVSDGTAVLATALGGLSGDLNDLKVDGLQSMADRFSAVAEAPNDFAQKAVGALARHRHILDIADSGLPSDPAALIDVALDILLPFPREALGGALAEVERLNAGLDDLTLPQTRFQGVIDLMAEIKVAADAGDAVALQAALDRLANLRIATISQVGSDIRAAGQALMGQGIGQGMTAVCDILDDLRVPDISIIDELVEWRTRILSSADHIGALDLDVVRGLVDELFDMAETELVAQFETQVDLQVDRLENWLRGLLAELPIAELRGKITASLQEAADKIEGAGIDEVAITMRSKIADLAAMIEGIDLQALINTAAQALADALALALDEIEAAIGTISAEIERVIAQVQDVLGRAISGVAAFGDAVQSVTDLIAQIDITAAAQAVIDVLSGLRETAEELLGALPLPEALRDEVAKFTEEVASIDVEGLVREPLMAAVDQLQIPDEIGGTIDDGLSQISDIVANLIPDNIAAELQAELGDLFDKMESLDLSEVLGGIGEELGKLADVLDQLDLVGAIKPADDAFKQAKGVLAGLRPSTVLAPVIRAYDDAIGALPLPDPQTMAERAGETVAAVGEPLANAATQPARALAGEADATPSLASDPVTTHNPLPTDVRPGDLIRLVGFLPAKLKEALDALEAGPAGEVMAGIDRATAGLAAEIRAFQTKLTTLEAAMDNGFDDILATLADATTQARVAVQASAAVTAGQVDLRASLDVIATLDASRVRAAVLEDLKFYQSQIIRVRRSVTGPIMAKTDQVADLLENTAIARLSGDLDALLAAIDPDPIADELDEMFNNILVLVFGVQGELEADLIRYKARLMALLERFNPGAQAQKFLRALNVLKELFDLLNPRRLADELDEVHQSIMTIFEAYSPAAFAAELQGLITATSATVRGLDPAALTPDFSPVEAQAARLTTLLPLAALEGVGEDLDTLGAELAAIDISALLDSVNTLTPQIVDAVELTAEGIKAEILALLGAIQYGNANVSVTLSANTNGAVSLAGGVSA